MAVCDFEEITIIGIGVVDVFIKFKSLILGNVLTKCLLVMIVQSFEEIVFDCGLVIFEFVQHIAQDLVICSSVWRDCG